MILIRWPYTEPHIAYARWGVRMPDGVLLKGLARDDVYEMHEEDPRVIVVRQTVVYVNGGPDEGHEVLGPWKQMRPLPASGERRDEGGQHPAQQA